MKNRLSTDEAASDTHQVVRNLITRACSSPDSPRKNIALAVHHRPLRKRIHDVFVFARNFAAHPRMLGTFLPSSHFLVSDILSSVEWKSARVIVEYGPGTGVITSEILKRMGSHAKLLAIELNPEFVECLRALGSDHRLLVRQGSAAHVRAYLNDIGVERADCVISGIPFTSISDSVRKQIVEATRNILEAEGQFIVYQFRKVVLPYLKENFSSVRYNMTLLNLFPIRIYRCQTPLRFATQCHDRLRLEVKGEIADVMA